MFLCVCQCIFVCSCSLIVYEKEPEEFCSMPNIRASCSPAYRSSCWLVFTLLFHLTTPASQWSKCVAVTWHITTIKGVRFFWWDHAGNSDNHPCNSLLRMWNWRLVSCLSMNVDEQSILKKHLLRWHTPKTMHLLKRLLKTK